MRSIFPVMIMKPSDKPGDAPPILLIEMKPGLWAASVAEPLPPEADSEMFLEIIESRATAPLKLEEHRSWRNFGINE